MSTAEIPPVLSAPQLAKHLGVPVWKIRRMCQRGLFPEPRRIGLHRAFDRKDIPKIKQAMISGGYLDPKDGAL